MFSLGNFAVSFARLAAGLLVLFAAASVPSYFIFADKEAVVAAGEGTASPLSIAKIYFDAGKISAALLAADAAAEGEELHKAAEEVYSKRPAWRVCGGDEPFFDAFLSTIHGGGKGGPGSVYSILSLGENRAKLLAFLSQSQSGLVAKFIDARKMPSSLLPPVYTSAGAPLEAALLTSALLAQTGDFTPEFLKDVSATFEAMRGDTAAKEKFEKYCVGLLALSSDMDWTLVRSLFRYFSSLGDAYEFARIYKSAPNEDARRAFAAAVLMGAGARGCAEYLRGADEQKWRDFSFAYINGEGALSFLLKSGKPIYRDGFAASKIAPLSAPIKARLGSWAAKWPRSMLALKVALSIFGGYLFIRGLIRIFAPVRDTPSWASPLALARGLLEGAAVSLAFFVLLEPEAFSIKIENAPAPELRFAFEKAINTIQEETMKFETDTATLAAVGLFFVLQLTVYLLGVIRLSSIKRMSAPAVLKLKLLENADNLFDLGLYIGLAGTVVSLILLTMGIVTASLMAAYASTLFGILFTAAIKIVHVRKYKRRLLIEAERDR